MKKVLTGTEAVGARAMQIVAEKHPERFTYDGQNIFLDGLTIGQALTEALEPCTVVALRRRQQQQAHDLESDAPMTDKRALEEIEIAKEIIDRHADSGWLASYGHDLNEGFFYSYWNGRYEERALQETEATA